MGKGPMGFGPIQAEKKPKSPVGPLLGDVVEDIRTVVKYPFAFNERGEETKQILHPGPKTKIRQLTEAPETLKKGGVAVKDKVMSYVTPLVDLKTQAGLNRGVKKTYKASEFGKKDEETKELIKIKSSVLMRQVQYTYENKPTEDASEEDKQAFKEKQKKKQKELVAQHISSLEEMKKDRLDNIDTEIKEKEQAVRKAKATAEEALRTAGVIKENEHIADPKKIISKLEYNPIERAKKYVNQAIKSVKSYQQKEKELGSLYELKKQEEERFKILIDDHKSFSQAMGISPDTVDSKTANAMFYARNQLGELEYKAEKTKDKDLRGDEVGKLKYGIKGIRSSVIVESHDGKESIMVNFGLWGKENTARAAALTSISKGWEKVNVIASKHPGQDRDVMLAHAKEYAIAYDLSAEEAMKRVSYKSDKSATPMKMEDGIKESIKTEMLKSGKNTYLSQTNPTTFYEKVEKESKKEIEKFKKEIEKYKKENGQKKGEIVAKRENELKSGEYAKEVNNIYKDYKGELLTDEHIATNILYGQFVQKTDDNLYNRDGLKNASPNVQAALFNGVPDENKAGVYNRMNIPDDSKEQFLNNLHTSSLKVLYTARGDGKKDFLDKLNQAKVNDLYDNLDKKDKSDFLTKLDDDKLKGLYKPLDENGRKNLVAELADGKKGVVAEVEADELSAKTKAIDNAGESKSSAQPNLERQLDQILKRGDKSFTTKVLQKFAEDGDGLVNIAKNIQDPKLMGRLINAVIDASGGSDDDKTMIKTLLNNFGGGNTSLTGVIKTTLQLAKQVQAQSQAGADDINNETADNNAQPTQAPKEDPQVSRVAKTLKMLPDEKLGQGEDNDKKNPREEAIRELKQDTSGDGKKLFNGVKGKLGSGEDADKAIGDKMGSQASVGETTDVINLSSFPQS